MLQIFPQVFNDVHIWAAGRPIKFINLFCLEPVLSKTRGVLQVTVLLEIDILLVDLQVPQGTQDVIVKDLNIKFCVHVALNATNATQALGGDTAPDHHVPTTMLYLLLDILIIKFLPLLPPTIMTPIRPKKVKFGLVGKDNGLSVIYAPVLVCFGPCLTLVHLCWGQERFFTTYVGLQATCGKSFLNGLSIHMWEAEPLKVGNIMCLGTGQHSGGDTCVTSGEFMGMTRFGLDIIEVINFCVPVVDVIDCGPVNIKNCSNLLI